MHARLLLVAVPLVLAVPFPFAGPDLPPALIDTYPVLHKVPIVDNSTWTALALGEDPTSDLEGVFAAGIPVEGLFNLVGKAPVALDGMNGMEKRSKKGKKTKTKAKATPPVVVVGQIPGIPNPKFEPTSTVLSKSTILFSSTSSSASTSTAVITTPPVVVPTSTALSVSASIRISTSIKPSPSSSSSMREVTPSSTASSVASSATSNLLVPMTSLGRTSSGKNLDAIHVGEGTFFAVGLGACGTTASDTDYIVAVSKLLYDTFPGATANPNTNPICGQRLEVTYMNTTINVVVQDRCEGCAIWDLDFSPTAFNRLADPSVGRLDGMEWIFL